MAALVRDHAYTEASALSVAWWVERAPDEQTRVARLQPFVGLLGFLGNVRDGDARRVEIAGDLLRECGYVEGTVG